MIRFFLIVNRSCKTRYAKYYQTIQDTSAFELEIARKCITRKQNQARIILRRRRTFLTKVQTLFFQLDEYKIGNFTTGQKKIRVSKSSKFTVCMLRYTLLLDVIWTMYGYRS